MNRLIALWRKETLALLRDRHGLAALFVMPVIGLTLPFISYGGSSLVMLFACMGLVSGVHGRAKPDWLR